jgi:uncharacterized protein (DUF362 family)
MNAIIASCNTVAADMTAAHLMGFSPHEIPTFAWANKAGLRPERLEEIEFRGDPLSDLRREFERPRILPWSVARGVWATREII